MDTTERRFETEIEHSLTTVEPGLRAYESRDPRGFDVDLGLYPDDLIDFVRETQPEQWARLERIHKGHARERCLKRVASEMDKRGVIEVLRRGVEDVGARIKLVNRLSIMRQLHYSKRNQNSVDTVLMVNGIPVVTMELKNPLTGQTYRDAISQYKKDRSPSELLFKLNRRAIVHFAVDTDEAWMTTKLAGQDTVFLPFNRGFENGAGNPPAEGNAIRCSTSFTALFSSCLTKRIAARIR